MVLVWTTGTASAQVAGNYAGKLWNGLYRQQRRRGWPHSIRRGWPMSAYLVVDAKVGSRHALAWKPLGPGGHLIQTEAVQYVNFVDAAGHTARHCSKAGRRHKGRVNSLLRSLATSLVAWGIGCLAHVFA
jgi:hypothetical protein